MNFGNAWKDFMGECSKNTAFEMLDYFYDQGGNFIDTASNYQAEESEQWLGEWMDARGTRDEMVIATKYCGNWQMHDKGKHRIQSNFGAAATKNLHVCVEASLRKLRTSYIDLVSPFILVPFPLTFGSRSAMSTDKHIQFYVHYWDMTTSIEELMQSLNALVLAGKILYLGISDTPAWWVVKANAYARHHGLRPFSVYQGKWSAAERDFERDIIPMCMDQGMALAPWGALGGGYFKPQDQLGIEKEGRNLPNVVSKNAVAVSAVLEKVAERKGTAITSVALAYVMHKSPYVFPIVGGRKVEHLKGNIEALKLRLTDEDIEEIEGGYEFDMGFPMNFLGLDGRARVEDNVLVRRLAVLDFVEGVRAIQPKE
ncbi:MAG: hypothetical protein Q9174_002899 [Haloplaca sp. 1 TL-2023]